MSFRQLRTSGLCQLPYIQAVGHDPLNLLHQSGSPESRRVDLPMHGPFFYSVEDLARHAIWNTMFRLMSSIAIGTSARKDSE